MKPRKDSLETKLQLCISFILVLSVVTYCEIAGPYNIEVRSAEDCGPKSDHGMVFEPRIRKFNRSAFILNSPVWFFVDYDDSLTLDISMALFTNNGWKENYYKQSFFNACSTTIIWGGELAMSFFKIIRAKPGCPVSKGNYTLKNWVLKLEVPNIPFWFYNKYKWRGILKKNEHSIGCLAAVVDVVPRKKH